jgi:hypothetical protein
MSFALMNIVFIVSGSTFGHCSVSYFETYSSGRYASGIRILRHITYFLYLLVTSSWHTKTKNLGAKRTFNSPSKL